MTKVMPDSPAAKAGLQENDVMVKLGDVSLSGPQSVTEAPVSYTHLDVYKRQAVAPSS